MTSYWFYFLYDISYNHKENKIWNMKGDKSHDEMDKS